MERLIFEHLDYPTALAGVHARLSETYDSLAEKLGVETRSKMKKFIKADLSMPKEVCDQFCALAGMSDTETTYMHLLRRIHYSGDVDQMLTLTKKLLEIRKKNAKGIAGEHLHEAQIEVFSEWYLFPLLFFFPAVKPVEVTAQSLSKAFRGQVGPNEAWAGVQKLVELGLLTTVEGGYKRTHVTVTLLDNSPRAVIRKFHKMMIGKALETIELPVDKRFLTAATFAVKKDKLPELHQKMNEFLAEMITIYSSPDGDSVHQLNMQAFSLMDR